MHVGQIITADSANGLGIRVSVFVSGCTNRCKGCFQPETWDFNYGKKYSKRIEEFILKEIAKSYCAGLTILGGEPLEPENQGMVLHLMRRVKREYTGKNIWLYTGFTYGNEIAPGGEKHTGYTDEILALTDVLVDGRFVAEKRNLMLKFRGSENQRLIDMNKTREAGEVVLLDI